MAIVVAMLAMAAWMVDPQQCRWAPKCMFHLLTGWQCPGCGFSRAAHAVMHGHFSEALGYNLFFIVSIPYLMAVALATVWPAMPYRRYVMHRYVAYAYVILAMIWWVVRNVIGI
jgi:hypothetical protein